MVKITPADVAILVEEGKGATFGFKENLSSSNPWELVGMTNATGGKVLLSVCDNGAVIGIEDSNALRARNYDPPVKALLAPNVEIVAVHARESDTRLVRHFFPEMYITEKLRKIKQCYRVKSEGNVILE